MEEEPRSQNLRCPKCRKRISIIDVKFKSTGRIFYDCYCPYCGRVMEFEFSIAQILYSCEVRHKRDSENEIENKSCGNGDKDSEHDIILPKTDEID